MKYSTPTIGARIALLGLLERQRPGTWYPWAELVATARGMLTSSLVLELEIAMRDFQETRFLERRGLAAKVEVRITATGVEELKRLVRGEAAKGTVTPDQMRHLL